MKRLMKALFAVFIVMVMCIPAAAVSENSLPVKVRTEGKFAERTEKFCIVLEAADENCPLPDGSADGKNSFMVEAGKTASLPEIVFEEYGVYGYLVYQQPGTNENCRYDDTVYHVTVYASGSEDEPDVFIVQKDENGIKLEEIVFVNAAVKQDDNSEPSQDDSGIPKTGVVDCWMYYIAGAAVLLIVAGWMAFVLLRQDGECNE